jgi:hypothetical protein
VSEREERRAVLAEEHEATAPVPELSEVFGNDPRRLAELLD